MNDVWGAVWDETETFQPVYRRYTARQHRAYKRLFNSIRREWRNIEKRSDHERRTFPRG